MRLPMNRTFSRAGSYPAIQAIALASQLPWAQLGLTHAILPHTFAAYAGGIVTRFNDDA